MPLRLISAQPDFHARFADLLAQKREQSADVAAAVADVIDQVRRRGDAALLEFTAKWDRLRPTSLRFDDEEIAAAARSADPAAVDALRLAADRIRTFHARHLPADDAFTDAMGVETGARWTPVAAAGLYVPGGKAAYPSSVLMNAIPAAVAGVPRIAMVVPTPDGTVNPLVLVAAQLAGVHEIFRIGGAQAVAALAFGTESIRPVDKIVGPGNAYVAAAKRMVYGQVGIDSIAGPSEILVVADAENDPSWIAADLLSQAEHDEVAQSILITDDAKFADRVVEEVGRQLSNGSRREIPSASWRDYGAVIVVRSLDEAPALVDALAPEHLELAVAAPDQLFSAIRNAGAVFLGRHTPEAIGDYVAGPNHVLPTARSARFSSGLSAQEFMKRTTFVRCSAESLGRLGPAAIRLAEAEGLPAHARSVALRLA